MGHCSAHAPRGEAASQWVVHQTSLAKSRPPMILEWEEKAVHGTHIYLGLERITGVAVVVPGWINRDSRSSDWVWQRERGRDVHRHVATPVHCNMWLINHEGTRKKEGNKENGSRSALQPQQKMGRMSRGENLGRRSTVTWGTTLRNRRPAQSWRCMTFFVSLSLQRFSSAPRSFLLNLRALHPAAS